VLLTFPLDGAFEIAVVRWILGNYRQPQLSWHQNRKACDVFDKFQDPCVRPAMTVADFRVE
jgi:hypothetical protein